MRIAHLDTGTTWRGGQAQVRMLMGELRALGHAQRLLAPPGPLLERAAADGFDAVPWPSRGEADLPAMLAAWRAVRAFAPDVAHLHSAHAHALGAWPSAWAGAKTIVVSRRVDVPVRANPLSRLKYGRPVDRYLCISDAVLRTLRGSGIDAGRLVRVPSGVDASAVRAEADEEAPGLRAWLGLAADAEIVGTVGALGPDKNHALLLEAVPLVLRERPRARFVWLGEGECRAALERRRSELRLERHVFLPGFQPQARALLRQFDLFALPSRIEGLCTSLLDAQVLGVPIVATAVGGVPEVVTDGVSGRLVGALSAPDLAAAIAEALAQPERRAAWAAAGRESVRAFDAGTTARRTVEVYREAVEGSATAHR